MTDLLRDPEAETTVLATVLIAPSVLRSLLVDQRLRPEHFAVTAHAATFEAFVRIEDRGDTPTEILLAAELEHEPRVPERRLFVGDLLATLPELGGVGALARRLRDLHRRRELRQAARLLIDAADGGDAAKLLEAERMLTSPEDAEPSTWTWQQLAERAKARLDEKAPEAWPWPFERMNSWTGGGLRRQQIILIGGWTAMGKSLLYDQVLEHLANRGLRCHSYINEMSEPERIDRTLARWSKVPFARIYRREFKSEEEREELRWCADQIRVGLTECAGWTAAEIARHIRWNRWDVAGVDILHEIPHRDERDLAEIAQVLRAAAKSVGCALIACVHLNDLRVTSPQRPKPVLRDVRGSGMLVRGADVVLFIHRDDDEDGVPGLGGLLSAAKVRNGSPAAMAVVFQPERMRFMPAAADRDLAAF